MATNSPLRLVATVLAAGCLLTGSLQAQDPPADPKTQDLANRFIRAKTMVTQGEYPEAAEIFEGILKEVPDARGSLLLSGFAYLEMGEYKKAADRLNQFQELEPDNVQGIIWAIRANQALDRDIKVRKLIDQLRTLRDSGKPLQGMENRDQFIREQRKQPDGSLIVISEFFDYKAEPNFLWTAEKISPDGITERRLALSYDAEATQEAVKKMGGKGAGDIEVFFLSEPEMDATGEVKEVKVYQQLVEKPSYASAKKMFLGAIASPPKPLIAE